MSIDWHHRSGYDRNLEALLDRLRARPTDVKWDTTATLVAEIDRLRADVVRLQTLMESGDLVRQQAAEIRRLAAENDVLRGRQCAC